jgi:phosphoribosylglycinamide formyltransferase-1
MKVGLLTYDTPHLKTEQIPCGLALEPGMAVDVLASPFSPRKPRAPRFQHRPDMNASITPAELSHQLGFGFSRVPEVGEIDRDFDYIIIGGAGLLPAEFVNRYKVVNCHPGLQPAVRGLDAFKWAIHDGQPLGVSLHLIDEEVDAGTHLKSVRTPVAANDTIETLARRHYELEIQLLIAFHRFAANPQPYLPGLEVRLPRLRMPAEAEKVMLERFDDYRAHVVQASR